MSFLKYLKKNMKLGFCQVDYLAGATVKLTRPYKINSNMICFETRLVQRPSQWYHYVESLGLIEFNNITEKFPMET